MKDVRDALICVVLALVLVTLFAASSKPGVAFNFDGVKHRFCIGTECK